MVGKGGVGEGLGVVRRTGRGGEGSGGEGWEGSGGEGWGLGREGRGSELREGCGRGEEG